MATNDDSGTAIDHGQGVKTRAYQQELLEESLRRNIIIALDTGSGKTHIAVLRLKHEVGKQQSKISWFMAPTVSLCKQQQTAIERSIPVSVGIVSGASEPDQWKDADLWKEVLSTHKIVVSTPQVLLDALRHSYVVMGRDISMLVFDEAHHADKRHPYSLIMQEFYFNIVERPIDPSSSVRPMILGLTASPSYGGNVQKSFQELERTLDSIICTASQTREELAKYVHRPKFQHALYRTPSGSEISENVEALKNVLETLDINEDPYVQNLRHQLQNHVPGSSEHKRTDQKLSKAISKEDTFTHRGLRDFLRAAEDIMSDLGVWASDWYVWSVMQKIRDAAVPTSKIMPTWRDREKAYLLNILTRIHVTPPSYSADDILKDCSDKVRVLVGCMLKEKAETEAYNEAYSGLVFVQRRDSVLALTELLNNHPDTNGVFHVAALLGTSDTSKRHSLLDITARLRKEAHDDILDGFKIGEYNLLVSTAVAEEGIDVQACGSVIRWDPPPNFVSWAQSRGRARKQRSTFTLLFSDISPMRKDIEKWERLEAEMVAYYMQPDRLRSETTDDDEDEVTFEVASTGALVSTNSAISHLAHFCNIIPHHGSEDYQPVYALNPPDYPLNWHANPVPLPAYTGPWGCTVTLPRTLRQDIRIHTTSQVHFTKQTAYKHAAFTAYVALYEEGLLDDTLLPFAYKHEEVEEIMKDVEKRAGMADVSLQLNPWKGGDTWYRSLVHIEGLPLLEMFTHTKLSDWTPEDGPTLYLPDGTRLTSTVQCVGSVHLEESAVLEAKAYTRRLFWWLMGARMEWDQVDFSYLFLPSPEHEEYESVWDERRDWSEEQCQMEGVELMAADVYNAKAQDFGQKFGYPEDIAIVRDGNRFNKPYKFVGWRIENDPLSEEEIEEVRSRYGSLLGEEWDLDYPLLQVETLPPRRNFLIPTNRQDSSYGATELKRTRYLLPDRSFVVLISHTEVQYTLLLPSILRALGMHMTAVSFQEQLLSSHPSLLSIPKSLLMTALTAPASQEKQNYQRLETMGDTVLKFVMSVQLLASYPMWHEGYLSRKKDHAVSNARLARENVNKSMYQWIIRDTMLGRKWKPRFLNEAPEKVEHKVENSVQTDTQGKRKKSKGKNQLSTKVLADVVESTIGAAYVHGGEDLGYEACKFFSMNIASWEPLQDRYEQMLQHLSAIAYDKDSLPLTEIGQVEKLIGYTFKHKLLPVEALTHASHQQYFGTISYERLEFLGDSVLDMIVTKYLYNAPGKNYSPGHLHLRKSAVVNAHTLAFSALRTTIKEETSMPGPDENGHIVVVRTTQEIPLYKCLLHSSPYVFETQQSTAARYKRRKEEIEEIMEKGTFFPWAALTHLQAPKYFSDMVESLIGAAFLDSSGDFAVAEGVMRKLGLWRILERIVEDEVDVLHPVSLMSLWASKHEKKVEYEYLNEKGNISCIVRIDGEQMHEETTIYSGRTSKDEVRFVAAEAMIQKLHLRDVKLGRDVNPTRKRRAAKNAKSSETK